MSLNPSYTTGEAAQYVYNLLLNTGLNDTLSKYATSEAAFETGGFNSAILKSNNNLFGMKYAGQVNALGEKNGYAYYSDWAHSVADWVAWYSRHRSNLLSLPLIITNIDSFVKFLKNNSYFEATLESYTGGVKSWYKSIFNLPV